MTAHAAPSRPTTYVASLAVIFSCIAPSTPASARPPESTKTGTPADAGLNLYEKYKDEYIATDKPAIVDIGPATYLTLTGRGDPGGDAFKQKIGVLYTVAYTINMKYRFSGRPYTVSALEGLWWGDDDKRDLSDQPKDTWNWKLLLRIPEFVTEEELADAVKQSAAQPKNVAAEKIKRETLTEGRCVQILHVGPYDGEHENIALMLAFAKKKGLIPTGRHHEIYLSDPNQVAPENLRTILRQPVK